MATDTESRTCACCSRTLPVSDWDEPRQNEVVLDAAGVRRRNEYVCGRCLDETDHGPDYVCEACR